LNELPNEHMLHLRASHPLNQQVTTMMYRTQIEPVNSDTFVTPTMVENAMMIITNGEAIKTFKNSFQINRTISELRPARKQRKINIKIFKNLTLVVAGTHCLEMADNVVDETKKALESALSIDLQEKSDAAMVDLVIYRHAFTGLSAYEKFNLAKVKQIFQSDEYNNLCIFDTKNFAGARVKMNIDNDKQASIMIFSGGSILITLPNQPDYDKTQHMVQTRLLSILSEKLPELTLSVEKPITQQKIKKTISKENRKI